MRSGAIWRWLSARAWSRKSLKRRRPWWSYGRLAGRSIEKSSGRRELTEKDLVAAKRGVARSEIRALSGAGIEDLSHWKPGRAAAKSQILLRVEKFTWRIYSSWKSR